MNLFRILPLFFIMILATSCLTIHGPVKLNTPLQKPVTSYMITNPVVTGNKKAIRSLERRITVKSISEQIQSAYAPVKKRLPGLLEATGAKTSSTTTRYAYTDLFDDSHKPKATKMKALIYEAEKLLVVPVVTITEFKEDVNIDNRTMCPGQYHSTMELSLRFVDSRGKLILDSTKIKRDNASIKQNLHGIHIAEKKCGMMYKPKQNFKSQFQNISVEYLKEVIATNTK